MLYPIDNKVIHCIDRHIFKCGQKCQYDRICITENNCCDMLRKTIPFLLYRFFGILYFVVDLIFSLCNSRKKQRLNKKNKRSSQFDNLN